MNYVECIDEALGFVEENLTEKINLEDVASRACLSPYHFHRVFKASTGLTPGEYIRRRRLTEAAGRILDTETRIIEAAVEFGFNSQEAFTRAFKKQFKTTPARFVRRGHLNPLYIQPRLTPKTLIHLNGGITMEPKIVEKKAFKVIGMMEPFTLKNNTIPQLWGKFMQRMNEIENKTDIETAYGICIMPNGRQDIEDFDENSEFLELVCTEVSDFDKVPEGMVTKKLPGLKYAVFTHKGPLANLQQTYNYIYSTWLPGSGYEPAADFDFELYDGRFKMNQPDSEIDIYFPIK